MKNISIHALQFPFTTSKTLLNYYSHTCFYKLSKEYPHNFFAVEWVNVPTQEKKKKKVLRIKRAQLKFRRWN